MKKGEYRPEEEFSSFAPALVTGSTATPAASSYVRKMLKVCVCLIRKLKTESLKKLYLCVTVGIPKEKSARLTAYHQKDENTKTASRYLTRNLREMAP